MSNNLQQVVEEIIFWPGFGAVAGASIAFLSGLFAQRLQRNWQKAAELEIEKIKGDISQNNGVLTAVLGHQGHFGQKVLERQIEAIQKAWEIVLQLKAVVPPVISIICNILTDEEIENGILDEDRGRGTFGELLGEIDMECFTSKYAPLNDEARKLRPFLSTKLSLQLFVYGAVIGRFVFVLSDSYKKNAVKVWRKDDGIKQILESILNDKEMKYVYFNEIQGYNKLTDLLETKILNEMSFMLSGQKSSEDILSQVSKFNAVLSASKPGN